MFKYWKRLLGVVVLIAAALGITYYVQPALSCESQVPGEGQVVPASESIRDKPVVLDDYVRYPGKNGKTALELLEALPNMTVGKQQFSFGVMVESIGGVKPSDKEFWKLYVNGQASPVGAGDLQTCRGDVIEWIIEDIQGESS